MNKKGFTLVELISMIVILGIIMVIVVVSVSDNIETSRDESFIELGKNYAESVRVMRSNGELLYEPKSNEAVIIPYAQIKNLNLTNPELTGYGKILPSYCFIGVINKNNNYSYFINQVDESYHILDRVNNNTVTREDVQASEDVLSNLAQVTAPLSSFSVEYNNSNYTFKGARVEFSANYKKENNLFVTSFDLVNRGIVFKGTIALHNWQNESNKTITMKIEKKELGILNSNKTYTFKKPSQSDMWIAVDSYDNPLNVGGKTLQIDIKSVGNDYVVFDLYLDDMIVYEGILTTTKTTLSGYYTDDNSYISSNAKLKGNIISYDNYAASNIPLATDNEFTIDGIKYTITGSEVKYIIVNK